MNILLQKYNTADILLLYTDKDILTVCDSYTQLTVCKNFTAFTAELVGVWFINNNINWITTWIVCYTIMVLTSLGGCDTETENGLNLIYRQNR